VTQAQEVTDLVQGNGEDICAATATIPTGPAVILTIKDDIRITGGGASTLKMGDGDAQRTRPP
jgi:hypothetical protein